MDLASDLLSVHKQKRQAMLSTRNLARGKRAHTVETEISGGPLCELDDSCRKSCCVEPAARWSCTVAGYEERW